MTQQSLELGEAGGIAAVGHESRRFNCILILWMTVLTIGLAANLSLHFIAIPGAPGKTLGREGTQNPPIPNKADVTFFDLVPSKSANEYGPISWNNKEDIDMEQSETLISIKEDGFYFLYGQVTLMSGSTGSNTVKIIKKSSNKGEEIVLESSIGEKSNSTGFFGKILRLEAQTSISINCSNHHLLKTDTKKNLFTFVGIYKMGKLGQSTD
ncbi:tumor necrosis factor ligand superfamily member 18 [Alosa pseudoharengus]|uniref:tumor necrosis factor ligand superfamily member 18 n=1 Tax=Alosa pseudoharengus TaxID=34774 RepID=UPI003F8A7F8C